MHRREDLWGPDGQFLFLLVHSGLVTELRPYSPGIRPRPVPR